MQQAAWETPVALWGQCWAGREDAAGIWWGECVCVCGGVKQPNSRLVLHKPNRTHDNETDRFPPRLMILGSRDFLSELSPFSLLPTGLFFLNHNFY